VLLYKEVDRTISYFQSSLCADVDIWNKTNKEQSLALICWHVS